MSEPTSDHVSPPAPAGDLPEPRESRPSSSVRRRRRTRTVRGYLTRPAVAVGIALVFVVTLWFGFQGYTAVAAYREISDDREALRAYEQRDLVTLNTSDARTMQAYFADIDTNLRRIDRAVSIPLLSDVAEQLPWIGPRVEAGRDLVDVGLLLAGAGHDGAAIGAEAMAAFEATGFSSDGDPSEQTWLDVIAREQPEIERIADDIAAARDRRASIDTSLLPSRVQARVDDLDRLLDRYDYETLAREQLPAALAALGADGPVRYWVLFPNPAELRPAGGFPGTGALVTFERGQLTGYEFHDMKKVSDEYLAERGEVVPSPLPIERYLWQGGFLPHDTVWWADFPRLGSDFMRLYAEIGWPEIDGVVAVQPSAVADLLSVVGNVTAEVDGEQREITAANVFEEMERQRALRRSGAATDTSHKEVIAVVGEEIMARLKASGRVALRAAAEKLEAAADRRDIQGYSVDPGVESFLDERGWSGRLVPDPSTPTLAVTFANMVATKSSQRMSPTATLHLGELADGTREATLDITLTHTGTNDEDPYYSGFQRWWVQVSLPEGSSVVSTLDAPQDDPDAPNGGAYLVEIFPQQSGTVSITFRMPESDRLLVRRQPGVTPVELAVDADGCEPFETTTLDADQTLDIAAHCRAD